MLITLPLTRTEYFWPQKKGTHKETIATYKETIATHKEIIGTHTTQEGQKFSREESDA